MELDRAAQIRGELLVLERRMRPLEWDLSRNQINEFRRSQLFKLRELKDNLERELTNLNEIEKNLMHSEG